MNIAKRLRVAACFLLAVLTLCVLLPDARAAETVDVDVPISASEDMLVKIEPQGGAPAPVESQFRVDATPKNMELRNLPLGTYVYKVTQVKETGVGYDKSVWTVTVYVYLLPNGEATSTVVAVKTPSNDVSHKPGEIFFGWSPVEGDPPIRITKKVTGKPKNPGSFVFVLKAVSNTAGYEVADMPMPAGAVNGELRVNQSGPGDHEFGKMTFPRPGTYVYRVYEVAGSDVTYKYDSTRYTLTFVVKETEEGSGILMAEQTIVNETTNAAVENCYFDNKYTPPSGPKTGDDSRVGLWIGLCAASLGGMTVSVIPFGRRRKAGRDEE